MNDSQPQIMFVDDEDDNIAQMKIVIKEHPDVQFYLHQSQGGVLKTLHKLNYMVDAVILDISLEDGSGRETTELIRKKETNYGHGRRIEIFWYTGWPIDLENVYQPETQTFYACSVRKLFQKPYGISELVAEVREFIGAAS